MTPEEWQQQVVEPVIAALEALRVDVSRRLAELENGDGNVPAEVVEEIGRAYCQLLDSWKAVLPAALDLAPLRALVERDLVEQLRKRGLH